MSTGVYMFLCKVPMPKNHIGAHLLQNNQAINHRHTTTIAITLTTRWPTYRKPAGTDAERTTRGYIVPCTDLCTRATTCGKVHTCITLFKLPLEAIPSAPAPATETMSARDTTRHDNNARGRERSIIHTYTRHDLRRGAYATGGTASPPP